MLFAILFPLCIQLQRLLDQPSPLFSSPFILLVLSASFGVLAFWTALNVCILAKKGLTLSGGEFFW